MCNKKFAHTFAPMKHFLLFILFPFFIPFAALAQNDTIRVFVTDSNIIQDKRVNELIMKHIIINEIKKGKTKGFRVQIHSSSERSKALEAQSSFSSYYPNVPVYLYYQAPYFKIHVGNFRTKLEAYKFLREISDKFTGAYIVNDEIEFPSL
jgi:hypothetical protein